MSASVRAQPWEPPVAVQPTITVIVASFQDRPDFTISLEILQEPKAQQAYRPAVGRNGVPYLFDPSAREKAVLRNLISTALIRDIGLRRFPLFNALGNETLKLDVTVHYHVSCDKDVDNMCKFLFDTLQGVFYLNDKSIWELEAKKYAVQEAETIDGNQPKTVFHITYCSM